MCQGGGERKAARGIGAWFDSPSPWRMAFASCGFVLLPPALSSFGVEREGLQLGEKLARTKMFIAPSAATGHDPGFRCNRHQMVVPMRKDEP